MAPRSQENNPTAANVLIDLKPHPAGSSGTGITRSRAASAP
jgi:hypothetical protein